jgi:hypothetical protein
MKSNSITTQQGEYGLFVKQLSRIIKFQNRQEKKFLNELHKGTLNPAVVQRR